MYILSTNKETIMNKNDLIEKIATSTGMTRIEAKKAIEVTTTAIREALSEGNKVVISGFGTFSVNDRSAREGINPSNGERIIIPAKKAVKFKAGADLLADL